MDKNQLVKDTERDKNAWAYMRRRSTLIGEFRDIEGAEWEEYMDRETSERFYWQEDVSVCIYIV